MARTGRLNSRIPRIRLENQTRLRQPLVDLLSALATAEVFGEECFEGAKEAQAVLPLSETMALVREDEISPVVYGIFRFLSHTYDIDVAIRTILF